MTRIFRKDSDFLNRVAELVDLPTAELVYLCKDIVVKSTLKSVAMKEVCASRGEMVKEILRKELKTSRIAEFEEREKNMFG